MCLYGFRLSLYVPVLFLICSSLARAQERVDERANELIRKKSMEESQVMDHLFWLTDVHGPRLTGSPDLLKASEWVLSRCKEWGLTNGHLEPWGPFGRGWTLNRFSMHVAEPVPFTVTAMPKAWSQDIEGLVEAEVVILKGETEEEWEAYRGKLRGKIVMLEEPRALVEPFEPIAKRLEAEDLLNLANSDGLSSPSRYSTDPEMIKRMHLAAQRIRFVYGEEPLALIDRYYKGDYGTIFVSSASVPSIEGKSYSEQPRPWHMDSTPVVPQFTLATEHYNRIYRLVDRGIPAKLQVELDATYHDEDAMAYNVIAEIPGTDPESGDEVVMLGAHLDSWHAGTGAIDNASGTAVMMEAVRILQEVYKELGVQPRRTIRLALWTGEEQGLFGSRAYVSDHFAESQGSGELHGKLKPEFEKLSAYYNFDNGTGKIRGVYLQGNEAVAPIFRTWLKPFADLGASTLSLVSTGGTDHVSFDAVGLPGFQFIQEPIAYSARSHHSNMDVYDHVLAEDLKQSATIVASFVFHTAQRDEKLPRKPLTQATGTN